MKRSYSWGLVGCMALMLVACGDQAVERPALPEGFDVDSTTGGKSDLLTRWFTEDKGPLVIGKQVTGKTSPAEWFHGYTLTLAAGDKIAVVGDGYDWGMLRLYGPQRSNGKWGWTAVRTYIRPQGAEYVAEISFTAPVAGTYLVVIGSPWLAYYGYTLSTACMSGSCSKKPHCLEYETTDSQGKPLHNFYATNVDSYDAGKQLLAQRSDFINEKILPGTCAAQSAGCPKIYKPVCGDLPGHLKKSYGNVCLFKVAIRQLAGAAGKFKGHWDDGKCDVPHCTIWQSASPAGSPEYAFYAVNVESYAAGKKLLAQMSYFINEDILSGPCDKQQLACPKVYKPICADTPTTPAKTYSNLCHFKGEVMKLAGQKGEHKGKWTDGVCPCDPKQEWYRSYVSTDAKQCSALKYSCPPHTWTFSNSCGCGCEQSSACPKWINCMPPVTPSCSDQKKKCPYSKVSY